jgi:hypothetical protein
MANLRILKALNLAAASFFALVSLPVMVFILAGVISFPGQPKEGLMFILFGLGFFGILVGLAVAHAWTGFMVTAGRSRPLQTALATVHLANFPVGTAYAVYALYVCYVDEAAGRVFATPSGRRVS